MEFYSAIKNKFAICNSVDEQNVVYSKMSDREIGTLSLICGI